MGVEWLGAGGRECFPKGYHFSAIHCTSQKWVLPTNVMDKPFSSEQPSSLQLCDVSFGCELPAVPRSKHKKKHTEKRMNHTSPGREPQGLPSLPPVASITDALLPEIQPTYRPMRLPDTQDSPLKRKRSMPLRKCLFTLCQIGPYRGGEEGSSFTSYIAGLRKNENLSLAFGQLALQFSLPKAILN